MKSLGRRVLALCLALCLVAALGLTASAAGGKDTVTAWTPTTITLKYSPSGAGGVFTASLNIPTELYNVAASANPALLNNLRFVCYLTADQAFPTGISVKKDYMKNTGAASAFTFDATESEQFAAGTVPGIAEAGLKFSYKLSGSDLSVLNGGKIDFESDVVSGAVSPLNSHAYLYIERLPAEWGVSGNRFLVAEGSDTYVASSGGGGGGGVEPATNVPANITLEEGADTDGVIDFGDSKTTPGAKVEATIDPNPGRKIEKVTITDKNGNPVHVDYDGQGGYSFTMPEGGVNIDVEYEKVPYLPSDSGVDELLKTDEHVWYIQGDDQGNFRPYDNVTRAEIATMLYRLLKNQDVTVTATLPDVDSEAWYVHYVGVIATLGIFKGDQDGNFNPEAPITRAEFATAVSRFATKTVDSIENPFSDIGPGHWAYNAVIKAVALGWINGYEDNTFRPNNPLTRTEAVAIINRMLARPGDKEQIHEEHMQVFPDVPEDYWGVYDVVESTFVHDPDFDEFLYEEHWDQQKPAA